MRMRLSASTGCPRRSHIRRICRFRPSVSTTWSSVHFASRLRTLPRAGRVRFPSSSTPRRKASTVAEETLHCTRATYSFSTPASASEKRAAKAVSFVKRRRPEVSASSRPTACTFSVPAGKRIASERFTQLRLLQLKRGGRMTTMTRVPRSSAVPTIRS